MEASYTDRDAPLLDQYWRYITERQTIWHRRFVLHQERPWTHDAVLQRYSFTNVYRELDRGTLFYKDNVLARFKDHPSDLLAATILFRRFNKNETWEECFAPHITPGSDWNWPAMYRALVRKNEERPPVFTAAFVVSGCRVQPGQTKIMNQWEDAYSDFMDSKMIWARINYQSDPRLLHKELMERPGIGPFLAYEIYSDLMYSGLLIPKEDDWANTGPGAKNGLNHIWPERRDYLQCMYELRDMQEQKFHDLNLPFWDYALRDEHAKVKWLTMRNIEHNLCEFHKWVRGSCRYQFEDHGTASYTELLGDQ